MEEELLKELKRNSEIQKNIEITANLNAIVLVLLKNNLITEEEYNELVEKSRQVSYKHIINSLTEEQKKEIEASKKFRDLFGRSLENFI